MWAQRSRRAISWRICAVEGLVGSVGLGGEVDGEVDGGLLLLLGRGLRVKEGVWKDICVSFWVGEWWMNGGRSWVVGEEGGALGGWEGFGNYEILRFILGCDSLLWQD